MNIESESSSESSPWAIFDLQHIPDEISFETHVAFICRDTRGRIIKLVLIDQGEGYEVGAEFYGPDGFMVRNLQADKIPEYLRLSTLPPLPELTSMLKKLRLLQDGFTDSAGDWTRGETAEGVGFGPADAYSEEKRKAYLRARCRELLITGQNYNRAHYITHLVPRGDFLRIFSYLNIYPPWITEMCRDSERKRLLMKIFSAMLDNDPVMMPRLDEESDFRLALDCLIAVEKSSSDGEEYIGLDIFEDDGFDMLDAIAKLRARALLYKHFADWKTPHRIFRQRFAFWFSIEYFRSQPELLQSLMETFPDDKRLKEPSEEDLDPMIREQLAVRTLDDLRRFLEKWEGKDPPKRETFDMRDYFRRIKLSELLETVHPDFLQRFIDVTSAREFRAFFAKESLEETRYREDRERDKTDTVSTLTARGVEPEFACRSVEVKFGRHDRYRDELHAKEKAETAASIQNLLKDFPNPGDLIDRILGVQNDRFPEII